MNEFAATAMWDHAVSDHDAEQRRGLVVSAKVALAGAWPFLAAAQSDEEFEHRLALMQDQIEAQTPPAVLGEVVAGLRQDWTDLMAQRVAADLESREAALRITASQGDTVPNAYVHVHKHGSGDDEYFQVDHVGSQNWVKTLTRAGSRDEAMQHAREFGLPAGLPIYENGMYVEGRLLPEVTAAQEFYNAETGKWERVATNYQPDPDAAWRYHYPPFGAQPPVGGQVTGPVPVDVAQGEGRSEEAYARQLTPGAWTVTPGTEWPQRPNAGRPGTPPVNAARKQAGEGAVPTPGPNPNYFSVGTQGLQGEQFAQDPAAEPKIDNHLNDIYGGVPPQMSSGSTEGQVDGEGYSRMAAKRESAHLTMHEAGTEKGYPSAGYEVHMHHGDDHFQVGWWPTAEAARKNGEDYGRTYGYGTPALGRKPVMFKDASRGRLGFNQARSGQVEANRSGYVNWDEEGHKQLPVDFDRDAWANDFHQREFNDGYADAWRGHRNHGRSPHYQSGYDSAIEGMKLQQKSQQQSSQERTGSRYENGGSYSGKHQVRVEKIGDRKWQALCETCGTSIGGPSKTQRAAIDRASDHNWVPYTSSKHAATDGKIVGHCDNCHTPVRWHNNADGSGELRHLHSNANKCTDSKSVATNTHATPKAASLPQFFDPTLQRTADLTLSAPTPENPTGRSQDEYRANTWDALVKQRPMQAPEDRGVNTPTLPGEPIKTRQINTPTPGLVGDENDVRAQDDEDDDEGDN